MAQNLVIKMPIKGRARFEKNLRGICMIPSVHLSHSPLFPLTLFPFPDTLVPTRISTGTALMHSETMVTAARVSVPGRTVDLSISKKREGQKIYIRSSRSSALDRCVKLSAQHRILAVLPPAFLDKLSCATYKRTQNVQV